MVFGGNMVLDYDGRLNIDVLVHPYWSDYIKDPIDIPNAKTHEKTKRWKSAIDQLGENDWLIFLRGDPLSGIDISIAVEEFLIIHLIPSARIVPEFMDELTRYAYGRLGNHMVIYTNEIGNDIRHRLGNPDPTQIGRIRGYGEFSYFCVQKWTDYVKRQLNVPGPDNNGHHLYKPKSEIITPLELSVSLIG